MSRVLTILTRTTSNSNASDLGALDFSIGDSLVFRMTRFVQPKGSRGSLKWIQHAANERWPSLDDPIAAALGSKVEWRSPLEDDDYAEYRDGDFLELVGLGRLRPELARFWPPRGPQWDALAVGSQGQVVLVEAKAHVGEMCSPPSGASEASKQFIERSLSSCAERLGARPGHAEWIDHFYQLANRLAHLQFLLDNGVQAYLILVNFLNDREISGPTAAETWEASYKVAFHVLGLGKRHPLSRHILHVFPDVAPARRARWPVMPGQVVLSRQELYDLVWSKAVSRVAPELGISDVALRKRCRALGIPCPDATYWGRFHAGKPVTKVPLGSAPNGVGDQIVFYPSRRNRPAEVQVAIEQSRAQPVERPAVSKRHQSVAKTMSAAREAKQDMQGGVKTGGPEQFCIRAHPDTLERANEFLEELVRVALARGFKVSPARESLGFSIDGETVGFLLSQTIRRSRHDPTAEEVAREERWDRKHRGDWNRWEGRPTIPFYDFLPTGEMSLEINGWPRPAGVTHRFADSRTRKIEERLDDIMASFAAHAANLRVHRLEEAQHRSNEERALLVRAERARQVALEKVRVEYLHSKLAQVRELSELRSLIDILNRSGDLRQSAFEAWAGTRLANLEVSLSSETIVAESAEMDAFQSQVDSTDA